MQSISDLQKEGHARLCEKLERHNLVKYALRFLRGTDITNPFWRLVLCFANSQLFLTSRSQDEDRVVLYFSSLFE